MIINFKTLPTQQNKLQKFSNFLAQNQNSFAANGNNEMLSNFEEIVDSGISEILNNFQNCQSDLIDYNLNILYSLIERFGSFAIEKFFMNNVFNRMIDYIKNSQLNYPEKIINILEKTIEFENFDWSPLINLNMITFLLNYLKEISLFISREKDHISNIDSKEFENAILLENRLIMVIFDLLEKHENPLIFFMEIPLLVRLNCIFQDFKGYVHPNIKSYFNIENISNFPTKVIYSILLYVIKCFGLFIDVSKVCNNDVHVVTDLLLDSCLSKCIQISKAGIKVLIDCSEKFPILFFKCYNHSKKEKALIFTLNVECSLLSYETNLKSKLLILKLLSNATSHFNEKDSINFFISYNNYLLSVFSKFLNDNYDIFVYPISKIIQNLIRKSESICNSLYSSETNNIIIQILSQYSESLNTQQKCSILLVYACTVININQSKMPDFAQNPKYLEDILDSLGSFDETQIPYLIQCIIKLLDFSMKTNSYIHIQDIVRNQLGYDSLKQISHVSEKSIVYINRLMEILS